jgi:Tfp pilus assembly protein FimT
VELVVVLVIISTLLAVTVPVFRQERLFPNRLRGVPSLARMIDSVKARAVRENLDIFLHVDPGAGRVWITDSSMETGAENRAADTPLELPDNLQIAGAELAQDHAREKTGQPEPGLVRIIRFSRHGYSDSAILHLTAGNTPVSMKIKPFMARVETIFDRISFDDCLSVR